MRELRKKSLGTRIGEVIVLITFFVGFYYLIKAHVPYYYYFFYYFLFKVWDDVNRIGDLIEYRDR